MAQSVKRVSIMIGEEQHQRILELGLNLSALIRELIEDYFSDQKITLVVSKKTHGLYKQVLLNSGGSNVDIEPHILAGIKSVLKDRIKGMIELEKTFGTNTQTRK